MNEFYESIPMPPSTDPAGAGTTVMTLADTTAQSGPAEPSEAGLEYRSGDPRGGGWGFGWPPGPPTPSPAPKQPRSLLLGALALMVVVTTLVGVGIGHALWQPASTPATSANSNSNSSGSNGSPTGGSSSGTLPSDGSSFGSGASGTGGPSDVSSIANKVDPGVVDINVTLGYRNGHAAGTGIVLTSSGEVLTNNHVINGATKISVTDVGNGRTYTASVVGYDRSHDIAVIQLHGASGLQTVSIGDSAKTGVGQAVVAIGNAGGAGGTPSAAGGSVVALNQTITASDQSDGTSEQLTGLIQVDADVQPGDSGGPLVDSAGHVIGLDTAASGGFSFQSAGGAGYAVPINEAMSIARHIEAGQGSATVHIGATAFLGVEVSGSAAPGDFGAQNGSTTSGATVAGVVSGSPAEGAGLSVGDTITQVGNRTIDSPSALTSAMGAQRPGDNLQIVWVDSSGQQHSATVQLAAGPAA